MLLTMKNQEEHMNILGLFSVESLLIPLGIVVLGYLAKKIPNDILKGTVTKVFKGLGTTVTLGLAKWKFTAPFWNKVIEPWVIDFVDNTIGGAVEGFIAGLRSDNPNGNG
jgi:hypothetical protein